MSPPRRFRASLTPPSDAPQQVPWIEPHFRRAPDPGWQQIASRGIPPESRRCRNLDILTARPRGEPLAGLEGTGEMKLRDLVTESFADAAVTAGDERGARRWTASTCCWPPQDSQNGQRGCILAIEKSPAPGWASGEWGCFDENYPTHLRVTRALRVWPTPTSPVSPPSPCWGRNQDAIRVGSRGHWFGLLSLMASCGPDEPGLTCGRMGNTILSNRPRRGDRGFDGWAGRANVSVDNVGLVLVLILLLVLA